jgi:hypothetical protein
MLYAIPEGLHRSAHAYNGETPNGWKLCCPVGHTWWYAGETEEQRLERLLKVQRDRAGRLAAERDQAQQEVTVHKRRATRFKNDRDRIKRRVAAGVCPCCNRSFQDVRRHMERQHPGFGEDAGGEA